MNKKDLHIKSLFVLAFVISCAVSLCAQTYHLKKEVLDMFSESKGDLWVTTYEGLEDYVFPVDLVLGYDGNSYKGLMHYPDTNEKVYLESEHDDKYKLSEYSENGTQTGSLFINKEEDYLSAQWHSVDGNIDLPILFIEDKVNKYRVPKSVNMLAGSFTSELDDLKVSIKFYRGAYESIVFIKSISDEVTIKMERANLGEYISKGELIINNKKVDQLGLDFQGDKFTLSYTLDGDVYSKPFKVEKIIKSDAITYSSMYTSGILEQVDEKLTKLSEYIENHSGTVANDIEIAKQNNNNGEYGYAERNQEKIGTDIQLHYIDDRYISGDLYIFRREAVEVMSFIYDQIKDEILEYKDLIDSRKIPAQISEQIKGKDQLYMMDTGLAFAGPYNVITGSRQFEVTHQQLREDYNPMIKSRTYRKHFLK